MKAKAKEPSNRKEIIKLVIALAVVAAGIGIWYGRSHGGESSVYDGFAKCLTQKHVMMYGLYWCEHCAEQKELFGNAFRYVNYQECGVKGQRALVEKCKVEGLQKYPTWQFADGKRHEGVMTMMQLSEASGCPLE